MNQLDSTENNAKISDSAYSNSCSNSQSRRSHCSKSTHSGSNSSGSSGYGGKLSTSDSSNQPPEKRSKEKKQVQAEAVSVAECRLPDPLPVQEAPCDEKIEVDEPRSPIHTDKNPESMDIALSDTPETKEEVSLRSSPDECTSLDFLVTSRSSASGSVSSCSIFEDKMSIKHPITTRSMACSTMGFSCVISMHDGVVMYTTPSFTTTLGFPKDMWLGRSFIQFVHPRDRNTFASQITSGLSVANGVKGTQEKDPAPTNGVTTTVCRIRRYRGLSSGFGVKDRNMTYMPFLLKLSFKNVNDEKGDVIYLVLQATPFLSAFKTSNEIMKKASPFVMRHAANGNLEYIDPKSVRYLGYLPQEIQGKNALQLYHPDDLAYLRQVYETIVREGGLAKSKPYRMMTQNGDYVKLETEWSSFINPWSRKLEFVTGKHHVLQGPYNTNLFQTPDPNKLPKIPMEEKKLHQALRDSIIKVMNEVLTKPAEIAKQQMTKRCQDLALFMESLMEEQPKTEDELRVEIQDADNSYYERDSLLGGISPHHDSKSSIETPLRYNQLNYNETLHRYFEGHQPLSYEDHKKVTGDNVLGLKYDKADYDNSKACLSSPVYAQNCADSSNLPRSADITLSRRYYQSVRLTKNLLNKHNAEMEKTLLRLHRETGSVAKEDREKTLNENRQKKMEHLARCNASFQPTDVATEASFERIEKKTYGVKRSSKQMDDEPPTHKHHCPSVKHTRRRHRANTSAAQVAATASGSRYVASAQAAAAQLYPDPVNNMNAYMLGMPQQMSHMSPMPMLQHMAAMPGMPGMFTMYCAPAAPSTSMYNPGMNTSVPHQHNNTQQFQAPPPPVPCMMYGQGMYGSPFMHSHMSYMPHTMIHQAPTFPYNGINPEINRLGLSSRTYEESTDAHPDSSFCTDTKKKRTGMRSSDENTYRTDGESSYSSFYSSFLRTDSGSAEESGDLKKGFGSNVRKSASDRWDKGMLDDHSSMEASSTYFKPKHVKKVTRRKMEPPWMDQVCVTSELIYKYQIRTKSVEEVLLEDRKKLSTLTQPALVNEQLSQLYLDLQFEGAAARLTLEEGITSSSSSGEETATNISEPRKKREYSRLVMVYEENAPLPPPA